MKDILPVITLVTVLLVGIISQATAAEDKAPAAGKWEFAVVKWDAPDRIYYNLPDKFELVYLSKTGVDIPKQAQKEQFCLAWAANQMAKEGWEAVNLNSRRILMRREIAQK